jgi:hypothetical protein
MCAVFLTLSFVLSGQLCRAYATAAHKDDVLERKVSVKIVYTDLHAVLSQLAGGYNIPIGFERASTDESVVDRKHVLDLRDRPVREVLDEIVKDNPGYKWAVLDNVINVFPSEGSRESLLDVVVSRMTVAPKTSRIDVRQALTEVPEVKAVLESSGVRPLHMMTSLADTSELSPGFSADWSNVTVRHILNDIAMRSSSHYWILSRYGRQREFLIVNF